MNVLRDKRVILPVTIAYLVLIFLISSMPAPPRPPGPPGFSSYLVHVLEFLILGILLHYSAYSLTDRFKSHEIYVLVLLFGIMYALTDEIHQFFVPGRVCSILDFVADSIGIVIGLHLTRDRSSS